MRTPALEVVGRCAVALAVGAIGSAVPVAVAEAACNAIPSADRQGPNPAPAPLGASAEATLSEFGYKGALGRIDRVYLFPSAGGTPARGGAPTAVVVPDSICIGVDGRATSTPPADLPPTGDLVVLTYFHSTDGKRVLVSPSASAGTCKELLRTVSERKLDAASLEVAQACSSEGPEPIVIKGLKGLRIPLARPTEIEHAPGPGVSPAVRIIVAPKEGAAALLASPGDRSCSAMCPQLVQAHALTCIDDIFALSVGPNGQAVYAPDPVPCYVQMPPSVSANDFAKACENTDTTQPTCQPGNPLPDLELWQDGCGGVHVPFLWTSIRPNTAPDTRWVEGRSGVGRKKPDEDPRIWVPGREFIGSTPILDPMGTAPGVSWRKPHIEVWMDQLDAPQEFGLRGTVDQDDSIVHVFPRLRTKLVCAGTNQSNACMGVEQDVSGGLVTCACEDKGVPGCSCEEAGTARYFICSSGVRRGMPCTRDQHCNYPDGTCSGTPHCQKPGDVWTGQPDDTGRECTVNDDCKAESDKTQCGYDLFNLEDTIENPTTTPSGHKAGKIVLDAKIVGGPHKRRGACRTNGANGEACGNGNGPGACAKGNCRGYQLKAGPLQ